MTKVLIVEDDPTANAFLGLLLTRAGHAVRAAGSVREAGQAAGEFKPDLLLLDWSLPDGTGRDVAEQVRKDNPHVKLVFLSAHPRETILVETEHLSPAAVLQKSAHPGELIAAIESAANKRVDQPPVR